MYAGETPVVHQLVPTEDIETIDTVNSTSTEADDGASIFSHELELVPIA